MQIRIASQDWPPCEYRVRYAESAESIFRFAGGKKCRHRYWALDVGPLHGTVRVNGQTWPRDDQTVALYAPGTFYQEDVEVGRLVSWTWLMIEEIGRRSLLRALTGPAGFVFLPDPQQKIRRGINELVAAATSPSPGRAFFLASWLNYILGTLFLLKAGDPASQSAGKGTVSGGELPWRRALLLLLDRSLPQTVTVRQFARELGVSPSTLTHRYRLMCGESFHETVRHWRLQKVAFLLSQRHRSIKEIAALAGFSHPQELSAFVKKTTGLSPSEFRHSTEPPAASG